MDHSRLLADLHDAAPMVMPSLLACDFARVEREIRQLEAAGARGLHLDVMDGHFVPNLSLGIPVIKAVRRTTELVLDVHLMISEPERYIETFREAGADLITIHVEAAGETAMLLERIRALGAGAGIALKPSTPVASVVAWLDRCDLVLVMSVEPGFGGQTFQPEALEKLAQLRERVDRDVLLSVDGGIGPKTIGPCARAGADLFVVGTALLGSDDYRRRFVELTTLSKPE